MLWVPSQSFSADAIHLRKEATEPFAVQTIVWIIRWEIVDKFTIILALTCSDQQWATEKGFILLCNHILIIWLQMNYHRESSGSVQKHAGDQVRWNVLGQASKWHEYWNCVLCHIKSTYCEWCKVVRPGPSVQPKISLTVSGTDLFTISSKFKVFSFV